jgi:hypothetical protein
VSRFLVALDGKFSLFSTGSITDSRQLEKRTASRVLRVLSIKETTKRYFHGFLLGRVRPVDVAVAILHGVSKSIYKSILGGLLF